MESASVTLGHATGDHHHGPPEANKSSKVDQTTLGLLIFLGLLGTFWGLLETIGAVADAIVGM